jgi:hypothetical protein
MIVLNSEKEIIRVENWADITGRPGFSGDLDPAQHKLVSIIGQYAFKDYVPCGLSNCHTPHGRGYIVVTTDGHETNIGKDCGKTYFGVDFETLSNKFDRDIAEKENREKLWSFFFRSDEIAAQVLTLRNEERGANWVFKQTDALQNIQKVPSKVVRRLAEMVKARDPILRQDREATENEIEQIEQTSGRRLQRPHYISISIGEVVGLDALLPENNLKFLLIENVSERIKELTETNIDLLTFEQLRKWSRWLGELDAVLERAVRAVRNGRMLLTKDNLIKFSDAVGLDSWEHQEFGAHLNQLTKL